MMIVIEIRKSLILGSDDDEEEVIFTSARKKFRVKWRWRECEELLGKVGRIFIHYGSDPKEQVLKTGLVAYQDDFCCS